MKFFIFISILFKSILAIYVTDTSMEHNSIKDLHDSSREEVNFIAKAPRRIGNICGFKHNGKPIYCANDKLLKPYALHWHQEKLKDFSNAIKI
ncbi:hypothetical protein DOY81_011472 [Sarcophaga bullata]|nr:hypothetical protein DOY81_011472 [Sarcophaga bullata]